MRMLACLAALVLACGAVPADAQKQARKLDVKPGASFAHKHSGIELPGELFGLKMTSVTENAADQLDVYANYEAPGQREAITVYIYRNVAGAVPVWFDRARDAIEKRGGAFASPQRLPGNPAFTPPGQKTASGLASAYALTGGDFRSTGLALLPMGEWLVKVRYSSATLSVGELSGRLPQLLGTLKWPRDIPEAPAAAEVAPCATPLAFEGTAKDVELDEKARMQSALMSGVIAAAAGEKKAKPAEKPPLWCSDSTQSQFGGIYRPDNATNSYLIALSDAGRGISVGPDVGALFSEAEKPGASWSVQFVELGETISFVPQDRLPTPARAIEVVRAGQVLSQVKTWGKERALTIGVK